MSVAEVDEDRLVMIHSPLPDVLRMNVLTSNPDDCEDEPLNHLAHRICLVFKAVVLRILPHDNNPSGLVVVEDLW